jgi:hypothetical protein
VPERSPAGSAVERFVDHPNAESIEANEEVLH